MSDLIRYWLYVMTRFVIEHCNATESVIDFGDIRVVNCSISIKSLFSNPTLGNLIKHLYYEIRPNKRFKNSLLINAFLQRVCHFHFKEVDNALKLYFTLDNILSVFLNSCYSATT
jgi:hypothetical protein